MSEILQIFHQSPPSHHQMRSHVQQGPQGIVDIEPQFKRSFKSDFPSPDRFQCYEFAGSSSVDELSKVAAVIETNHSLKKRKLESVDCDFGLTEPPEANRSIRNGNSRPSMDLKPEPDHYVHVRARRGQATNSHSLAERVRREKIKKKMQYLQDLVPGCNKLTSKAAILDEIITYVQCLQSDVEFLTMKLAALTACVDFNMDNLLLEEQIQLLSGSE